MPVKLTYKYGSGEQCHEAKGYVSIYSPEPALWEEEENEQFTQPSGFFHSTDIA